MANLPADDVTRMRTRLSDTPRGDAPASGGRALGRYRLLTQLGRGGRGVT